MLQGWYNAKIPHKRILTFKQRPFGRRRPALLICLYISNINPLV